MELKEATRGKAQWEDELPKVNTGTGDASTLALGAVAKRKRQLQHLHALVLRGPGASEGPRRALQDALDKAGPPEFQDKLRQAAGNAELVWALVVQARVQEDELLVEHRKERRNQWYEWVTTCFASNQRRLYGWIREGPKAVKVSPPTQRRDGSWRVGLQGQIEAVEEAWWQLWQGKPAPKPDVEKLFAPLAQVPCLTRKTAMTPKLLHEMGKENGGQQSGWNGRLGWSALSPMALGLMGVGQRAV